MQAGELVLVRVILQLFRSRGHPDPQWSNLVTESVYEHGEEGLDRLTSTARTFAGIVKGSATVQEKGGAEIMGRREDNEEQR